MKLLNFGAAFICLLGAIDAMPSWQSVGFALLAYFFVISGLDNNNDSE